MGMECRGEKRREGRVVRAGKGREGRGRPFY